MTLRADCALLFCSDVLDDVDDDAQSADIVKVDCIKGAWEEVGVVDAFAILNVNRKWRN